MAENKKKNAAKNNKGSKTAKKENHAKHDAKTDMAVKAKKDSTSASVKKKNVGDKEDNNTWMMISIILGVLVVLLVITIGIILYTGYNCDVSDVVVGGDNVSNGDEEPQVNLLIVEDPSCETCQVDVFVSGIQESLMPTLTYEKVDYNSERGQTIVGELSANQVPIYLFSDNLNQRSDWDELEQAFVSTQVEGETYFMLNPQFVPAKVLVEEPVILDSAVVIGDENAPVTVFEFTDYECPYCAIAEGSSTLVEQFRAQNPSYEPPIPKVMQEYVESGDVKIVFYNFPIPSLHPQAQGAHMAAMCANDQGMFKEYSDKLWNDRDNWIESNDREEVYKSYAADVGLDEAEFAQCLEDETFEGAIQEHIALGRSYGVSGTPAFFIGKNFISGAQDYSVFKELIDAELASE